MRFRTQHATPAINERSRPHTRTRNNTVDFQNMARRRAQRGPANRGPALALHSMALVALVPLVFLVLPRMSPVLLAGCAATAVIVAIGFVVSTWIGPTASSRHPVQFQRVMASLSNSIRQGVVSSCVIDAFIPRSRICDAARVGVVTFYHNWLRWNPTQFDRQCAYTRNAHRQRIGPRVAAYLTAASLAAIGSSTYLDLFALRSLAVAHDVVATVHMASPHSGVSSRRVQAHHLPSFWHLFLLLPLCTARLYGLRRERLGPNRCRR